MIRIRSATGIELQGRLLGGRERENMLLAEAGSYSFCQPSAAGLVVGSALAVETDARSAQRRLDKTSVDDWWDRLNERAQARYEVTEGLFFGYRAQDDPPKEFDWTELYLLHLSERLKAAYAQRPIPEPFDLVVGMQLCKAIVVATFFPAHDEVDAVVSAFRAGFIPLYWNGKWPKGHLEVYCPADRSHASAGKVDRNEVKRAAIAKREQLVNRHRAHPGYVYAPAVMIDHLAAWRQLASGGSPSAIAAHLEPLTGDAASRRLLAMIAARVTRVEITGGILDITLQDTDGCPHVLRCAPPWTGAIARLPAELISLLRVHNGIRLMEPMEPMEAIELFPFNGNEFTISAEWSDANREDGIFNDEPWTVAPVLLPLTNGQDLFVYHPTEPLPDGRAHLMMMSHETARAEEVDVAAGGVGPLFLWLLASRLGLLNGL